MLQIIERRKMTRASVGFRLHPDDFDESRGRVRRHVHNHEHLNELINRAIAQQLGNNLVEEIVEPELTRRRLEEEAHQRGEFMMPAGLPKDQREFLEQLQTAGRLAKQQQLEQEALALQKEKVFADYIHRQNQPQPAQSVSLFKCFEEHIARLKSEGSIGTATSYNATLTKLKLFSKDLPMNEINLQWIKGLDNYMIKEGLKVNSKHRHHKNIRALLNTLLREGTILKNLIRAFGSRLKRWRRTTSRNRNWWNLKALN
jgi:hypothetical protein